MLNILVGIKKINKYLLPLAAFFILISTAATNFFIILTVFIAFILCVKNNSFAEIYINDFFFKICFLIFSLLVISIVYSIAEGDDALNAIKKYIKIIYIPFIYYYLKKFKNEELVLKFFLYGTTFILILSYIKYFNIINFGHFYDYVKFLNISGVNQEVIEVKATIFQNYIIQGIIFSFYSFFCLYKASKNNNFILYTLSLLAFINVLFLNDSRTAYIIIIMLTLLSFYKILINNKIRLAFLSIIVILMASDFSNNFEERVGLINSDIDFLENREHYSSSLGMRFIWLKIGLYNISNQPILGNGVGSFYKSSENYFEKNNISNYKSYITNNPHCEFISISTQLGIIGLLSFLIFLYLLITCNGGLMSVATSIVFIISSLFNSVFYDNMLGLFLVIIISLFYKNKSETSIRK